MLSILDLTIDGHVMVFFCTFQANQEELAPPKGKLEKIAWELLTTEKAYVERLHLVDQVGTIKLIIIISLFTHCNKNSNSTNFFLNS